MLNFENVRAYRCPRWESLPDIDLYMDQLLLVLDRQLSVFRENENEKTVTSAMINNYVKQKITPAPVNKKYTRYHVAFLYVVLVLKNYMSLSDVCRGVSALLSGRHSAEAFDMFCAELETAIASVFSDVPDGRPLPETDAGKLLRAVTAACANMLYVKCMIGSMSSGEDVKSVVAD